MFEKILIAEDHQSVNRWLQQSLKHFGCSLVEYAYDCDNAYKFLEIASRNNIPFDLLITDLSFKAQAKVVQLASGTELIAAARKLLPDLKILVFSAEGQPMVVSGLIEQFGINGYILKGPNDEDDMINALTAIRKGKTFVSRELNQSLRSKNAHDFTDYDITIISEMVKGTLQKNIPIVLEKNGYKASSLRSVEKRLSDIRDALGFTKNEQLIAYCKDCLII